MKFLALVGQLCITTPLIKLWFIRYILVVQDEAVPVVGKLFFLDLHSEPKANLDIWSGSCILFWNNPKWIFSFHRPMSSIVVWVFSRISASCTFGICYQVDKNELLGPLFLFPHVLWSMVLRTLDQDFEYFADHSKIELNMLPTDL